MNYNQKAKYYLNRKQVYTDNFESLKNEGLTNDALIIKFLVKQEYYDLKKRYNYYYAQEFLADKYNISVSTVQNYLYR